MYKWRLDCWRGEAGGQVGKWMLMMVIEIVVVVVVVVVVAVGEGRRRCGRRRWAHWKVGLT